MQKVRRHGLTEGEPAQKTDVRGQKTEKRARQSRARPSVVCRLSSERLASGEPAPTACRHPVSGSLSLPSSGCFSPFPHGTGPLSVTEEYLGLEGGPPIFRQGFTCPALLEDIGAFYP